MIDHGNGMGGPAGTSEVNAANRDALRRLDRQPAHRVVQIAVIDWANSLNGRAPVGEDLARLIQTLTGRVEADRVSNSEELMTKWEYTSESGNAAERESRYDCMRKMGEDGWEAWHMERLPNGWWEIYFKRPLPHS